MADNQPKGHGNRLQDRTGVQHGHLTPIRYTGMAGGRSTWECRCDCGNVVIRSSGYLGALGERASCGCVDSVLRVEVACKGCGKLFHVPKFQSRRAAFCSNDCRIIAMVAARKAGGHGDVHLTCFTCGKPFTVPYLRRSATFCSPKCKVEAQTMKVELTCTHCGINYFRSPSQAKSRRGNKGSFCSWLCKVIGSTSIETRVRLRGRCNRCGYDKESAVLTIHHRDRNKRNNTRDNLELLCPTCHAVEHYNATDGPFRTLKTGCHRLAESIQKLRQALTDFESTTGRKSPFWDF